MLHIAEWSVEYRHWESHHIASEAWLLWTHLPSFSTCSCWCYSLLLPLHSLLLLLSVSSISFHFIPLYLNIITRKFTLTEKSCLLLRHRPVVAFHCNEWKPLYWILWSCFQVFSYLSTSCTYQCACCALGSHEFHSRKTTVNGGAAARRFYCVLMFMHVGECG